MAYDTITIRSAEHTRRLVILERLLYVCGGVVLALLLLFATLLSDWADAATMLGLAGLLLGIGVAWGLVRAKLLEPATHVLFLALIAATIVTGLPEGTRSPALYALFLPIVGSTLLLRPIWSLGYAALALLAYLLIYLAGPFPETKSAAGFVFSMVLFGGYFGVVALLSYLGSRGYNRLLTVTLGHAEELERARDDLEQRVAERTVDLRLALEQVERGSETIQQMSVPVVPVADGVLALPLVGALDSQRAGLLTERLLEAIHRERARSVLIDITGVSIVDTQVAAALLRAAEAVRMLGAEPVLVGIRAEVAHTIVGLGLDLSHITSRRDLRSGIAYVLGDDRWN